VVSIFPGYFEPLKLSLVGKAIESGLVDVSIHDLRGWAHDRHHTVDDTPYGGGAGMVMKPEPWGEAVDAVLAQADLQNTGPTLIVPTPSGQLFTQALAGRLSNSEHLVFACGRYEGIDQRVIDYARTRLPVAEVSLGDYVLNGGEVAVLAIIEAVVRLIPGVLGNPESLLEESHTAELGGLLEYPVYTKPASWRGLEVPEVLLSGHHGNIEAWRKSKSLERTKAHRPELLGEAG
jgi:tRNA (guanine37-N1)-methyltransferase